TAPSDAAVDAPSIPDGLWRRNPRNGTTGGNSVGHRDVGIASHDAPLCGVGIDAGDVQRWRRPTPRSDHDSDATAHYLSRRCARSKSGMADRPHRFDVGGASPHKKVEGMLLAR